MEKIAVFTYWRSVCASQSVIPLRSTKRRIEHEYKQTPAEFVNVITLRRLQADRENETGGKDVEWHWHWSVRAHWRNQWYPADGVHRPLFIESYIKGDLDKPFKPIGNKLFVASK